MLANARKRAASGLSSSTEALLDVHVRPSGLTNADKSCEIQTLLLCDFALLLLSEGRAPWSVLARPQPTLVYQDIRSFLLGSAEAVQSENGRLSRDDYLARALFEMACDDALVWTATARFVSCAAAVPAAWG